jgi:hypothetical protein
MGEQPGRRRGIERRLPGTAQRLIEGRDHRRLGMRFDAGQMHRVDRCDLSATQGGNGRRDSRGIRQRNGQLLHRIGLLAAGESHRTPGRDLAQPRHRFVIELAL